MPLPDTTTYTEFRENLSDHFKRLKKTSRPTIVTQNGKAAAVVLSPSAFEEYAAAREFMETARAVEESRRDFAAGRFMSIDEAEKTLAARVRKGTAPRTRKAG